MTTTAASTGTQTKHHNLTRRARTLRKVTVNFTERGWAAVRSAASINGHTQTETINKAAEFWAEAAEAQEAGGAVYIRHGEGEKLERLHLL